MNVCRGRAYSVSAWWCCSAAAANLPRVRRRLRVDRAGCGVERRTSELVGVVAEQPIRAIRDAGHRRRGGHAGHERAHVCLCLSVGTRVCRIDPQRSTHAGDPMSASNRGHAPIVVAAPLKVSAHCFRRPARAVTGFETAAAPSLRTAILGSSSCGTAPPMRVLRFRKPASLWLLEFMSIPLASAAQAARFSGDVHTRKNTPTDHGAPTRTRFGDRDFRIG